MPPLLHSALLVALSLLLVRRGRLALGILLVPTAELFGRAADVGWGGVLDSTLGVATLVLWALSALTLLWAPLRARALGRAAYARALRTVDLSARDERVQPSDLERWAAVGKPWRAAVQHPREPLRARTAKIEAQLDEALERLRGRTLQGHVDLTPTQWKDLASAGLLGAGIDAEHGGLGLEPLTHSDLVARAAGCAVPVAEALAESGPGGFADLIAAFGTDQQRETLLPRLARGEALGALAWTGIDQLPGESFATVVRTRQNGEDVLAARLQFSFDAVELAPRAAFVAVALPTFDPDGLLARAEGGESTGDDAPERAEGAPETSVGTTCFLVPIGAAGVECAGYSTKVTSSLPTGPLASGNVLLPLDHVLGGEMGFGQGDHVRRRSLELRAGWRTAAVACGIAEYAARVAGNVAVVDRARARTHDDALGRIASQLVTVDALRRAACARLGAGPGGALMLGAGNEALRMSRRALELAFESTGPQSGVRGAAAALQPLEGWLAASSAAIGASARALTWLVVDRGLASVAIDGPAELDALRTGDRTAFERLRWRRCARFAALGVSLLARAPARLLPWSTRGRGQDVDELGRAFALTSEAFVRASRTGDGWESERAARGLGRAFLGVLGTVALEEARHVDAGSTVQAAIRAQAHERALAGGWRGLLTTLGTLRGGFGLTFARVCVGAAAPARRVADSSGLGAAADEFLFSHDARQNLTSNVHVPGADDPSLGALERSARVAYAAERPLRLIENAIADGQLPALDPRNAAELAELAERATELSIVSESDRQSVLMADTLARELRAGGAARAERQQRTSA